MVKLFISHQSDDKLAAFDLQRKLEDIGGVEAWLDMFELNAGDTFDDIPEAIEDADAIIVLWSTSSDVSEWVRTEVDISERYGKRIIPCILDENLPSKHPVLRDRLYLDFRHPALGTGHLCLSYVVPTVLADHGYVDAERAVRRYEGVVGVCIRELIVRQRGLDDIHEWIDRAREARDEVIEIIDDMTGRWRRLEREVSDVLDGVDDIIGDMHDALEAVLSELDELHRRGELDDGPIDLSTLFDGFDRGAAHEEFAELLSRYDLPIPVGLASELLTYYVQSSFDVAEALLDVAERVDRELGADDESTGERPDEALDRINQALVDYLVDEDDLLPDDTPGIGYLDDAWMILNVGYRLVECGLAHPDELGVDWRLIETADQYARALMPWEVTERLEEFLLELVAIAANHVEGYDPRMEPDADGVPRLFIL